MNNIETSAERREFFEEIDNLIRSGRKADADMRIAARQANLDRQTREESRPPCPAFLEGFN